MLVFHAGFRLHGDISVLMMECLPVPVATDVKTVAMCG